MKAFPTWEFEQGYNNGVSNQLVMYLKLKKSQF